MKTFSQFKEQASPYAPYKPNPNDPKRPTQPPEGFEKFREKYGLPPKPVQQAQMVPQKPPIAPGVPLNLDNPAQRLRNLQLQRKDTTT